MPIRRAVSGALIVAGSLLLIAAGGSVTRSAIARDAARSRWAEVEARRAVADGRAALTSGPRLAPARGVPVARLVIPRLGVDEVVVEGVGEPELRAGPGHMIGSAAPGDSGTSVISAHRDRHFHALAGIAVGDTIITETERARVTRKVARLRVVEADEPALRSTVSPTLTLTTCWPIRYLGPAPDRLIVDAVPVANRDMGTGNWE
jgi:sortase A